MSKRNQVPSALEVVDKISDFNMFAEGALEMLNKAFPDNPIEHIVVRVNQNSEKGRIFISIRLVYEPKKGNINKHHIRYLRDIVDILNGTTYTGEVYIKKTGEVINKTFPLSPEEVFIKYMTVTEYNELMNEDEGEETATNNNTEDNETNNDATVQEEVTEQTDE